MQTGHGDAVSCIRFGLTFLWEYVSKQMDKFLEADSSTLLLWFPARAFCDLGLDPKLGSPD